MKLLLFNLCLLSCHGRGVCCRCFYFVLRFCFIGLMSVRSRPCVRNPACRKHLGEVDLAEAHPDFGVDALGFACSQPVWARDHIVGGEHSFVEADLGVAQVLFGAFHVGAGHVEGLECFLEFEFGLLHLKFHFLLEVFEQQTLLCVGGGFDGGAVMVVLASPVPDGDGDACPTLKPPLTRLLNPSIRLGVENEYDPTMPTLGSIVPMAIRSRLSSTFTPWRTASRSWRLASTSLHVVGVGRGSGAARYAGILVGECHGGTHRLSADLCQRHP